MRRPWPIVFLVAGALTLAPAVATLAGGQAAAKAGAVALGLTLLVCAFLARDAGAPEEPLRTGTVRVQGRELTGLIVTFSRRRAALAIVACALFAAGGVALATAGSVLAGAVGAVGAVVFGAFAAFGAWSAASGRNQLVLTEDAFAHVAPAGSAIVRWDDVTGVSRVVVLGVEILAVGTSGRVEMAGGLTVGLARLLRRSDLTLSVDALGVDDRWLQELIEVCARDPAARAWVARGDAPPPA